MLDPNKEHKVQTSVLRKQLEEDWTVQNKGDKLDKAYNEEQIKINKNKLLELWQNRLQAGHKNINRNQLVASQSISDQVAIEHSKSLKKHVTIA